MNQLSHNIHILRNKVVEIAKRAGRDPSEITLVAVSKNQSVEAIRALFAEGCCDFAENRVQEAITKIPFLPPKIRWHFIGNLQKNKVVKVVGEFAMIHSVASIELAQKISEQSILKGIHSSILLQIKGSQEETKQGMSAEECLKNVHKFFALPNIKVEGLMTMTALNADEKETRACFQKLRLLRDKLFLKHLSMGMSRDYPIAIEEGATLLRIGTALFER